VGDPGAGALAEGTRRCSCGRVYGTYHAGRHLCFVMDAPGRRQVERCVRCGVQLHVRSTGDCTPAATGAAVRATPVAEARVA
jgi:hypothetical protein